MRLNTSELRGQYFLSEKDELFPTGLTGAIAPVVDLKYLWVLLAKGGGGDSCSYTESVRIPCVSMGSGIIEKLMGFRKRRREWKWANGWNAWCVL